MRPAPLSRAAFICLLLGAVGIAFAPLFVRWSEVGPSATAFHRLLLALPFLWLWNLLQLGSRAQTTTSAASNLDTPPPKSPFSPWLLLPGLFFAGDLALWHWSIQLTSVANATLFANFAPIFVTVAARFLFLEQIRPRFFVALALALTGASLVVGSSFSLTQRHVLGDLLGLATALFYAGYMLSVKFVRRNHNTLQVMIWSSLTACPILLGIAVASRETLLPLTTSGWTVLIALALISQVAGQGLIAYAFRHLPASFSSLSLLIQPVVAATLAWLMLAEPLSPLQALGGLVVLFAIAIATRSLPPPPSSPSPSSSS